MKKLISIFFVLILLLLTLIGCESKKTEYDHSVPNIQSSTEYFSSVEEYYDFFFSFYKYEDVSGNIEIKDYVEGDVVKYQKGEDFYYFVDDIQKGERKIYIPRLSDEWKFRDISLYEATMPLDEPYVSFCYNYGEESVYMGYSYIPYYYIYYPVVVADGDPIFRKSENSLNLCREMYRRKGKDVDAILENNYSEVYKKQIQLKDRSVQATFYKYKDDYNGAYDVTFVYDDVCVSFERVPSEIIAENLLKDFYLEEYIPPETSTAPAETTQPAA